MGAYTSAHARRRDILKIIIDSGHGGTDFGGGTNNLFNEKDINLKISMYQYKRLTELGFEVVLTRNSDTYLDHNTRAKIVNESGADLCISNHINNVTNKNANGCEVLKSIYDHSKLAEMILDHIAIEGITKRRVVTRTLPKDKTQDYYFMHRLIKCQSLIIEYGFASNENDAKIVSSQWAKLGEGTVQAIVKYASKNGENQLNTPFIVNDTLKRIEDKLDKILNVFKLYQSNNNDLN